MFVPLTISDFLDRAALVHPDRTAVVDEPGVPGSLGAISAPSPSLKPAAVIQYSSTGFSNQAEPHSLGVTQSPVAAIARPIAA